MNVGFHWLSRYFPLNRNIRNTFYALHDLFGARNGWMWRQTPETLCWSIHVFYWLTRISLCFALNICMNHGPQVIPLSYNHCSSAHRPTKIAFVSHKHASRSTTILSYSRCRFDVNTKKFNVYRPRHASHSARTMTNNHFSLSNKNKSEFICVVTAFPIPIYIQIIFCVVKSITNLLFQ